MALAALVLICATPQEPSPDWLLGERPFAARIERDARSVVLDNGLVRREWRLEPAAACVAFDDLVCDRSLLRGPRPEARIVVDGESFDVGGLLGQPNQAFLTDAWLERLEADPQAFVLVGLETGAPRERVVWPRVRHHAPDAVWPPAGVALRLDFAPPASAAQLSGLVLSVHYELYDGIPVFSKYISLRNGTGRVLELDRMTVELLAVVERGNEVETRAGVALAEPDVLHVESDYAMGGFSARTANRFAVHWRPDPDYATQVNWARQNPCLLVVEPEHGPDVRIEPGASFESFQVFELVQDSTERERRGLARRRMLRSVAPWVTENPLILHVVSSDDEVVRAAIDQAAECGFEMVSLSFGSGLDMEDTSEANRARFAALAEYGRQRGIELGGYSLLSSRRITPDTDNCIHPDTGQPGGQTHGFCPALASDWGQSYFTALRGFFEQTGFRQFTHDGSYPGDLDAAQRLPLQRGVEDSRWVQWRTITEFYQWLLARGVYLRVPDHYYLAGSNECGMGYREVNWSLPRAQQVVHTRQNVFDGTWEKTPSMGWMFVPLTEYHGGGAAATIEPLDAHLDHYARMLDANLGLGVQAVYRGTRLYDTPRVRDMVRGRVDWYLRYREVLEADLIHGRRADGRDLDWMLHVNPGGTPRGMLVVYNPLERERARTLQVDLHYTGVRGSARVSHAGAPATALELAGGTRLELPVRVGAGEMTWFSID